MFIIMTLNRFGIVTFLDSPVVEQQNNNARYKCFGNAIGEKILRANAKVPALNYDLPPADTVLA